MDKIRNFCIIAHIDHGKSTLADRLLEITHSVDKRSMRSQLLDTMELEQERGITIKLQPARMSYTLDSTAYTLNLIDTPGHVDFSYEVSRSLAACEGAILVVDASQGIQAQTLANVYLAIEAGLMIVPVVNKIDLPQAQGPKVAQEIASLIGCSADEVIQISAKTGANVGAILEAVIKKVPPPTEKLPGQTRALIFDSVYDEYRGVILFVRVVDGVIKTGQQLLMMGSKTSGDAQEVGWFAPKLTPSPNISAGAIGYIVSNLRSVTEARVGDTVTLKAEPANEALPGYKEVRPFVYASFFPSSNDQYPQLKEALGKLSLNDASLRFNPESSPVLGFGFRVGFLGLLHLEIIKERLQREYGLELVITNPSTDYEVILTDGRLDNIQAAYQLPDTAKIKEIKEPWIKGEIIAPKGYIGKVLEIITESRGSQTAIKYPDADTAQVEFKAPLANIITDFYDRLKSGTQGYGSLSYELDEYRAEKLVKLDILVGGELVEPLSQIVHKQEAVRAARLLVGKLKEVIPRQLFEVSLQAAIGGKIIAREDVKALGKNVTGHLYGGDISRKRKLWEKQKAGKQRMKKIGKVEIPPEAFMVVLKRD